jgi:hypothetical protein
MRVFLVLFFICWFVYSSGSGFLLHGVDAMAGWPQGQRMYGDVSATQIVDSLGRIRRASFLTKPTEERFLPDRGDTFGLKYLRVVGENEFHVTLMSH